MKNRIFLIILSTMLSLPICVWAVDDKFSSQQNISEVQTLDKTSVEQISTETKQYKQPISKKKIAKKFLLAMSGVAISSFTIFVLLTIYNRIREGYINPIKTIEGETSLETPDDLNSAVKTFLNKTNW